MDAAEIKRRMRVAREYGGFESREQLAAAIGEPGLSEASLGQIERGQKLAPPRSLKTIADACGVPHAWLLDETYDPFKAAADETAETEGPELQAQLNQISDRLAALGLAVSNLGADPSRRSPRAVEPPSQAGGSQR